MVRGDLVKRSVNMQLLLTCGSLPALDLLLLLPQLCLHLLPPKLRLFVDQLIQQLKGFRMNDWRWRCEVRGSPGGQEAFSPHPARLPSCCRFSQHPAPSAERRCFCLCQETLLVQRWPADDSWRNMVQLNYIITCACVCVCLCDWPVVAVAWIAGSDV